MTLWSATQIPHILRVLVAATLGISETKLRVIAPDVGGGFGSKLDVYAEELLAVAVARRLDAPVKWIEERSENAVATIHGRDFVTTLELGATKDGMINPSVPTCSRRWAHTCSSSPRASRCSVRGSTRARTRSRLRVTFTGVFTNTTPTDAYRGAGRPEATYVLERPWTPSPASSASIRPSCGGATSSPSSRPRSRPGSTFDTGNYQASLEG